MYDHLSLSLRLAANCKGAGMHKLGVKSLRICLNYEPVRTASLRRSAQRPAAKDLTVSHLEGMSWIIVLQCAKVDSQDRFPKSALYSSGGGGELLDVILWIPQRDSLRP